MKALTSIKFSEIKPNNQYIIIATRYERFIADPCVSKGSGADILDLIEELFDWDEEEYVDLPSFLEVAESLNGDGWPLVEVYSI